MKNLYQELPLLQHASTSKSEMTKSFSSANRKAVRFDKFDYELNIPSHREFTPSEHESMWYTSTEYGVFALNEVREKLTMPLDQRKQKHKRMLRIDNVRRTVLKSQSYQLLEQKMTDTDNEYSEWLANYVQQFSEQSAAEARQRGIENDLELLDFKLQEVASKITKRPANAKQVLQADKHDVTKNARWSNNDLRDVAPSTIERSSSLRIELCKDFCVDTSAEGQEQRRLQSRRRRRRGSIRLYNRSS